MRAVIYARYSSDLQSSASIDQIDRAQVAEVLSGRGSRNLLQNPCNDGASLHYNQASMLLHAVSRHHDALREIRD